MPATPAGARRVDDPGELAEFFSDVPGAHIYALADLEAPFWEPSVWLRRDDAVLGLVRLPDSEAVTVYAVATKDPAATLELVAAVVPGLPAGTLLTAPLGLGDAIERTREVVWEAPHVRYVLDGPVAGDNDVGVQPLGAEHVGDLLDLYASEPGAAFFLPHMVDDESFVGVYDGGRLVAAAGTHVLSTTHGCAAIGGVYTRPEHRGLGLGGAVTAGVVRRIGTRAPIVGLNVAEANAAARSVYERLGFNPIHRYAEAEVR